MTNKYIPGTHILWSEYRCSCCGRLPTGFFEVDDGISIEFMMLFKSFETIRKKLGNKPLRITRGYTCPEHQIEIYLQQIIKKYGSLSFGKIPEIARDKTITPFSVHPFGLAFDILPKTDQRQKLIEEARMIKPKLRIGHKVYEGNENPHVHIDHGHMITPKFSEKLREGAEW